MNLTIEDVESTLDQYEVKPRIMNELGLAAIDNYSIYFNPWKIKTETEFLETILHEIAHMIFEDEENENIIEAIALETMKDEKIVEYLQIFFTQEIDKYWREK